MHDIRASTVYLFPPDRAQKEKTYKAAEEKVRTSDLLVAVGVVTMIIAVLGYISIGILTDEQDAGDVDEVRGGGAIEGGDAVRGPGFQLQQ